jgi:hypothetical protein
MQMESERGDIGAGAGDSAGADQVPPDVPWNPVQRLADYIEAINLTPVPLPDEYRYAALPLCIIDAVFSIGVHYRTTAATVARFCERSGWPRCALSRYDRGVGSPSVTAFLQLFAGMGPEAAADTLFSNRQRTSSTSGILKAEATQRFALALSEAGIDGFADLSPERLEVAEAIILGLPGQASGIAFDYFRMLAGDDNLIKPDRMLQRFVAEALGMITDPTARQTALLVRFATRHLQDRGLLWTPLTLDHALWRRQSGRDGSAGANKNVI